VADEIRIENVGGENGVASEVTLARLVTAMEKMASKTGADPKSQGAKTQKAYNDAQKEGVKVSTKHRDAVEDNTDAVKDNTKYLNLMGSGLFKLASAGIGAAIGGLKGFADELLTGGDSLSSFAQHIPLVGSTLTMFTGILDRSYQSFQSMATAGADFGYSLSDLRSTAAEARLPLEEFSAMVAQNTQMMAGFGGTVTQGARKVAGMTDALGSDMLIQLQSMGLSMEQVNEQMSLSAYLNRAGSRSEVQDRAAQAEAAASLTKNMLTLSKLTGEDIKTQQDKLAQAQMDIAFQMELAKLDKDEREKLNAAMAEAQATGGKVAVDALKAEFLGMPPVTRELQMFTATQSENANLVSAMLQKALDTSVTQEQFAAGQSDRMADYLEAQVAAAGDLEGILALAAAGGEGIPGEISALFEGQTDKIGKYFTDTGSGLVFARDKFIEDMEASKAVPPKDGELNAMGEFLTAVGNAKKALTDNFINPIVETLTPALNSMTEWFTGFVGEEGSAAPFQTALEGFSTYLTETVTPKLQEFFKAFGEDPGKAIKEALFGSEDGEKKGLIGSVLAPIGSALATGIKDGFKAIFTDPDVIGGLVLAIGGLFAAKAVVSALAAGATSLAGSLGTKAAARLGGGAATGAATATATGAGATAAGIGKQALRRLGPLALLFGAYDMYSTSQNNELSDAQKTEEYAATGGGMAGGLAGAAAGAALGSVVPVIGTAIGGLIGGTLGYFGGSAAGRAIGSADEDGSPSASQNDMAENLGLTPEAIQRLEKMSGIGAGMERVAGAFERINNLENFAANVNAIQKDLDINELSQYNRHMQEIARSLEDMNKALAEDNKGLFGGGSGTAAADVIKNMGSGMGQEVANQLNTTLGAMNDTLIQIRDVNTAHKRLTQELVD
jgi:hypothetical protein